MIPPNRHSAVRSEKLARYLARCGVASRRKCEEYIQVGWVRVDGEIIRTPETRIFAESSIILVRGQKVVPPENFQYILLNKPPGILCTRKPGREKGKTIFDIVKVAERLHSIGRLDRDTSGLLILTNDGELTQRLTHPSFQKEKEYLVETIDPVAPKVLIKLQKGVQLEDGISAFFRVEKANERIVMVVLTEGRKRQIRRTFKAVGCAVKKLHRIRIGNLTLGDLPEGHWRYLNPSEVEELRKTSK